MIRPPFANYHRAELERLVQEGFEAIERRAIERLSVAQWGRLEGTLMHDAEFQVLVAADYYLRTTG